SLLPTPVCSSLYHSNSDFGSEYFVLPFLLLGFDQVTRLCVAASPLYRPCWDFFGGFSVRRLGAQVRKIARRGGPDSSPTGPQIGRVCDPTAQWPAVCRPPQAPLTVSPRAAPN